MHVKISNLDCKVFAPVLPKLTWGTVRGLGTIREASMSRNRAAIMTLTSTGVSRGRVLRVVALPWVLGCEGTEEKRESYIFSPPREEHRY